MLKVKNYMAGNLPLFLTNDEITSPANVFGEEAVEIDISLP